MAANTARNQKKKTSGRTRPGATAQKRSGSAGGRPSAGRSVRSSSGTASSKGKNVSRRTQRVSESYSEPVGDEIRLIIVLAICALLLLSTFGLGGRAGDRLASVLFGIFGSLAYVFPFALFAGTAFHMSNRESRLAGIKLTAAFCFLWSIASLIAVTSLGSEPISGLKDGYQVCAASHTGGGLLGYLTGYPVYKAFGQPGSVLIFAALLLISGILVTGHRVFIRLWGIIRNGSAQLGGRISDARMQRAEERYEKMQREEAQDQPEDSYTDDDYEDLPDDMDGSADDPEDTEPAPASDRASFTAGRRLAADDGRASVTAARSLAADDGRTAIAAGRETAAAKPSVSINLKPYTDPKKKTARPVPSVTISGNTEAEAVQDSAKPTAAEPVKLKDIRVPEFLKGGKVHDSVAVKVQRPGASESAVLPAAVPEETAAEAVTDEVNDKAAEKAAEKGLSAADMTAPEETVGSVLPSARHEDAAADAAGIAEINGEPLKKYEFPPLSLLKEGHSSASVHADSLRQTALKLQETFDSFGVGITVTNVSCGPSVTRYEVQPDTGVKVSRIVSLADDIRLNLAVADIRIEAPIPGKAAVGIEVPNTNKELVCLRELLSSDSADKMKSKIAFAVGKDIGGQTVMANIEKMPHLLIAGATGSGKSVCINTIIMSILYRATPEEVKMIMIDPKVVELTMYNGLPHLLIPVVTDPKKAAAALNWAVQTMMDRYNMFSQAGVKDISGYNAKVDKMLAKGQETEEFKKMPQILIIIDELADLMMVAQAEVENAIVRLAQLARAAGLHLVIATQRPSVNVITGLIKANVPSRIAFAVTSGVDSRTILDMNGAEKLLGNGDMLFYPQGYPKPVRIQGAFVSEEEIGRVTDFIKGQYSGPVVYDKDITSNIDSTAAMAGFSQGADSTENDHDLYFEEAGKFIIEKEKASIGMLQRVFKIGFNRAARIMDQLADAGVVGPEIGTKPRKILMTKEEFEQYLASH